MIHAVMALLLVGLLLPISALAKEATPPSKATTKVDKAQKTDKKTDKKASNKTSKKIDKKASKKQDAKTPSLKDRIKASNAKIRRDIEASNAKIRKSFEKSNANIRRDIRKNNAKTRENNQKIKEAFTSSDKKKKKRLKKQRKALDDEHASLEARLDANNARLAAALQRSNERLKKRLAKSNARLKRQLEASNAKARASWDETIEKIASHQVYLHDAKIALDEKLDFMEAKRHGKVEPLVHDYLIDGYYIYYDVALNKPLTPPTLGFLKGIDGLKTPDFDTYKPSFPLIMYSPSHLPLLAKRLRIPPALLPKPFGFTFVANGFVETSKVKKLNVKGGIHIGPITTPGLGTGGADLNIDNVMIDKATSEVKVENKFLGGQFDVDILPFLGFNIMGGYVENMVTTNVHDVHFVISGRAGMQGISGLVVNNMIINNLVPILKKLGMYGGGSVTCHTNKKGKCNNTQQPHFNSLDVGIGNLEIKNDTRGYIIGAGPNFKFGYKGFFTMLNLMMLYINLDEYKKDGSVTKGFISKPVFVYYPRLGYNYKWLSTYVGLYGYKLIGAAKGKGNPLPDAVAKILQLDSFGAVLDSNPIAYTIGISATLAKLWFIGMEYQISSTKQGWNLAIGARF